jgi:hypothetical protein
VPTDGILARTLRRAAADAYRLAVAGTTAALAAFLLLRLTAWPPHEDESLTYFVSRQPLGDLVETVIGERGGAPLHFLLAHAVAALWPGLTGLRLISVVFAVASIPVVAALIRRLTDNRTAVVATILVAASWMTIFHGIYARMYSLFLFTSALSFLLLLRALERGTRGAWALWAAAVFAALATQPYGALVLAAQAVYVLYTRWRERVSLTVPAVAFAAVVALAAPLWLTYARLAARFDVGLTGGGSKLGSPIDVAGYFRDVVADFSAGWDQALAPIALVALVGFAALARTRRPAAVLTAAVFLVPAVAFLGARSGASVSLESRHMIFALPFFAAALAAGLIRIAALAGRFRPAALAALVATLVVVEGAWGWNIVPALYTGEDPARKASRAEASAWLAATSRPGDVYFAYEPLYYDADRDGADIETIVQRADPKLALDTLGEAPKPLGRGVWVFDATDQQDRSKVQLSIAELRPSPAYEARAYGPFLVLRTVEPTRDVQTFLYRTAAVELLGKELSVGDAGLNYQTAIIALERLRSQRAER